jgi:hypothetical protein
MDEIKHVEIHSRLSNIRGNIVKSVCGQDSGLVVGWMGGGKI